MSDSRKSLGNLTRTAAAISDRFKIPCSKQDIKNWQKWNPPFPMPGANQSYPTYECFEWIETHYMPKFGKVTSEGGQSLAEKAQEAQLRSKIQAQEDAAFESEVMRGKYIDRKIAQNTIRDVVQGIRVFYQEENEKSATVERKAKLLEMGIAPEIVFQFHEWDLLQAQARDDRVADKCQKEAK